MVVQRQPELQAPPNTEWNYNNTGFILLSLTVERLLGQSFADYMRDDLAHWILNYRDATLGGPEAIEAITTTAVLESGDSTGYGLGLGIGEMVARHLDMADPLTLRHTGGDDFSSSVVFLNTIAFERGDNGRMTGFTVSNGRTKGIWFRKL